MRQVVAGMLVDGDAVGMDVVAARLEQCTAGILDTVLAAIVGIIIRLAIGQGDEDAGTGLGLTQQSTQVADGEPIRV